MNRLFFNRQATIRCLFLLPLLFISLIAFAQPATFANNIKILTIGDSITVGMANNYSQKTYFSPNYYHRYGSYRGELWEYLYNDGKGITNVIETNNKSLFFIDKNNNKFKLTTAEPAKGGENNWGYFCKDIGEHPSLPNSQPVADKIICQNDDLQNFWAYSGKTSYDFSIDNLAYQGFSLLPSTAGEIVLIQLSTNDIFLPKRALITSNFLMMLRGILQQLSLKYIEQKIAN